MQDAIFEFLLFSFTGLIYLFIKFFFQFMKNDLNASWKIGEAFYLTSSFISFSVVEKKRKTNLKIKF